jgi:hypothetical protein
MLQHDGLTYCWAPADAKAERTSCKPEQPATSSLSECIKKLRHEVTLFTTEEVATQKLTGCMSAKGWQLIWIDGAMLFGERHNYSLKRTAASWYGKLQLLAAAAA